MTATLAERLQATRARRFVGRARESALFAGLLAADSPCSLLYVHGFGGVGKTSWLAHCERIAEQAGTPVLRLDARSVPPEPAQILSALGLVGRPQSALQALRDGGTGVLLIDTFEFWQSLEAWVREELFPQLPAGLRIVICGRRPPAPEWSLDPGWREMMSVCQMLNFSQDEASLYLRQRQVPEARVDEAVRFSHGNPLALAIAADLLETDPALELRHSVNREATRHLVERLTREGLHPEQRIALQASAVALETTEPLLAALLPGADAHALFQWLSQLSFMNLGPGGLYPHDLVREILMAELRARHPGRYEELARGAFDHETAGLLKLPAADLPRVAAAMQHAVHGLRELPGLEGFLVVNAGGEMYIDLVKPADLPAIEALIERHESAAALTIFRHWYQLQPMQLVVLRGPDRQVLGYCYMMSPKFTTPAQRAADPFVDQLWRGVEARGGLNSQQQAQCCRFWGAGDRYQASSPMATMLMTFCFGYAVTFPNLASMSMAAGEDVDYWVRFAKLVHVDIPPELELRIGGRGYRGFTTDWRPESGETRADWLRAFARRVTGDPPAGAALKATAATAPIGEDAFVDAVKAALQHFHETHELQKSPLLQSRMVSARSAADAGASARLQALREVIRDTVQQLGAIPKTERVSRVLHRTYIEPARSQQLAADALAMGYSTYRRQLARAREVIAAELWQLEQ